MNSDSAKPKLKVELEPSPSPGLVSEGRRKGGAGRLATHPVLVLGLVLLSIMLLGWSFCFRLPVAIPDVNVRARAAVDGEEPTETALSQESMEALRRRVGEARQVLVRGDGGLVKLVGEVERLALAEGWRAEMSVTAPQPGPPGLVGVEVHPAVLSLSPVDGAVGYEGVLRFLRGFSVLGKKVELVGMSLQGRADGLQAAQLELEIWTDRTNEKVLE